MKPKVRKGFRKPRVKRPKEKNVPRGYDSNWEYELHNGILSDWDFHTEKIDYVIEHFYAPDFIRSFQGKVILLEAKGRFWDSAEYNKYKWIKKVLPKYMELVFLFANPSAPMPGAKRRKDGTKRTHAEWATANGFRWFSEDSIPDSWINTKARESLIEPEKR